MDFYKLNLNLKCYFRQHSTTRSSIRPNPTRLSSSFMPIGGLECQISSKKHSRCGHCRAFAPFYRDFAAQIVLWGEVVKVAAINCADSFNSDICRRNGVDHFPLVKVRKSSFLYKKEQLCFSIFHAFQPYIETLKKYRLFIQ